MSGTSEGACQESWPTIEGIVRGMRTFSTNKRMMKFACEGEWYQGKNSTFDTQQSISEGLHECGPEVAGQVLQEGQGPHHVGHRLGIEIVHDGHGMLHARHQPILGRLVGQGGTRQQGDCQGLQGLCG